MKKTIEIPSKEKRYLVEVHSYSRSKSVTQNYLVYAETMFDAPWQIPNSQLPKEYAFGKVVRVK
jgi:hypothetical protein